MLLKIVYRRSLKAQNIYKNILATLVSSLVIQWKAGWPTLNIEKSRAHKIPRISLDTILRRVFGPI